MAGYIMIIFKTLQFRFLFLTYSFYIRTSGMKSASGRRIYRTGYISHQNLSFFSKFRIRDRYSRQQCLGIGVFRAIK